MTTHYYMRQLMFACALFAFACTTQGKHLTSATFAFLTASTLLYPFAKYLYDSMMGFLMGNNLFILPAVPHLIIKGMMVLLLWFGALLFAPFGIALVNHQRLKASK